MGACHPGTVRKKPQERILLLGWFWFGCIHHVDQTDFKPSLPPCLASKVWNYRPMPQHLPYQRKILQCKSLYLINNTAWESGFNKRQACTENSGLTSDTGYRRKHMEGTDGDTRRTRVLSEGGVRNKHQQLQLSGKLRKVCAPEPEDSLDVAKMRSQSKKKKLKQKISQKHCSTALL